MSLSDIGAVGGIPALVGALTTHKDNAKVCDEILEIIYRLTGGAMNDAVREAGGIPALVTAIMTHKDNANICANGCTALCYLTHNNAVNRDAVRAANGIPAIMTAFATHKNDATVCEDACWALGMMACENATNVDAIREVGAIPAIVAALVGYKSESACYALKNLASAANRDAIRAAGGIPALVAALTTNERFSYGKTWQSYENTWQFACKALRNLSFENPANQDAIRAAGAIPAIVAALTKPWIPRAACKSACSTLCNLATDNDANRDAIRAAGGIPAIVAALTSHQDLKYAVAHHAREAEWAQEILNEL
jgi:hypothetical protein